MMHLAGGGRRWQRVVVLLSVVAALAMALYGGEAQAQRMVVESGADQALESAETSGYASSPGQEDGLLSTRTLKAKVTITRTRVHSVVDLEAGGDHEQAIDAVEMPASAREIEMCDGEAHGQCAAPEAESLPPVSSDELDAAIDQDTRRLGDAASGLESVDEVVMDAEGGAVAVESTNGEEELPQSAHEEEEQEQVESTEMVRNPTESRVSLPDKAALNAAAKHLKELEEQLRVVLPQLKDRVNTALSEMRRAYASMVATVSELWHALARQCQAVYREAKDVYDHFVAEAMALLVSIYGEVSAVARDVYAVGSVWVMVVAVHVRDVWQTYEEIRIMTHHFVSVCLLGLLGGVFFSVYGVIATVPGTLVSMYNSLDDLTRAQIKIVAVLVFTYTFYQLRVQWTFWVCVALAAVFYYWSGHAVKAKAPLQRQPSRSAAAYAHASLKPTTR